MLVIRWLRYKDLLGVGGGFDEVMRPDICHNLCSGVDFCVKLLLEAVNLPSMDVSFVRLRN